jgi:hypothetical protein
MVPCLLFLWIPVVVLGVVVVEIGDHIVNAIVARI